MNEDALPAGWVWTRLGEIATIMDVDHKMPKDQENGVMFISPKDFVGQDGIDFENAKLISEDDFQRLSRKCKPEIGDIIYSRIGTIGKVRKVPPDIKFQISYSLCLIRPVSLLQQSDFLYWFLKSPSILEQALAKRRSIGVPDLGLGDINKFLTPLPPLPEQRRIVTKIEEFFTKLDAGISALKKTQAQLKRYRQSVLKAACEGKLVQTAAELARAEGRDYEPADVLMARILKERREKSIGTKYKEPAAPDINGLPEGWYWTSLEEIAEINPKLPNNDITNDFEVSFLPMRVVEEQTGKFDLSIIRKYGEVKKGYTSFINGDIIFAKITPCMENGKIAIVDNLKNGIGFGSTEFHVIRLFGDDVSRTFIFYFIVQENFRKDAQRSMTGSAGQLRVPANYLRQTLIPLPPLAEQRRIVSEVERRLSVADEVARTVEQSLAQAQRLRQSILKKAFEGKLVAQNPEDEPAGVLLERIRKEKARIGEKKRKR